MKSRPNTLNLKSVLGFLRNPANVTLERRKNLKEIRPKTIYLPVWDTFIA
jgi:hypothetical protein